MLYALKKILSKIIRQIETKIVSHLKIILFSVATSNTAAVTLERFFHFCLHILCLMAFFFNFGFLCILSVLSF